GSSIVLTSASFFLISFFISPKQRYLKLKNKKINK
ncbi:MAG: manganese ABC transporter substrate-binding protein, partial [Streptococcus sp.]|nr:manganese ABC transporter substrate-binding protein [Streptococcus sp.]